VVVRSVVVVVTAQAVQVAAVMVCHITVMELLALLILVRAVDRSARVDQV
jgi:hypothetical protein